MLPAFPRALELVQRQSSMPKQGPVSGRQTPPLQSVDVLEYNAGLYSQPFPNDPKEEIASMPNVRVKENEPFEVALRRFKRSCEKAGVLAEVRRREFYEKPTSERKRKKAAAVKRHHKKLQRENRRWDRPF